MKKILSICALACALAFTVACKKDDAPKADWKTIPSEIITAESGNATLTVNEVPVNVGNAKLIANGETTGILTLTNVVPGYKTIPFNVQLKSIDENTFSFTGETSLTEGPAIIALKSSSAPVYDINAEGQISVDGKITVNAYTHVNEQAQGGLAGTWNLKRKCGTLESELGTLPAEAPIWLDWKISNEQYVAISSLSAIVGQIGSAMLANYFDHVTFSESGNITAGYWESEDSGDSDSDEGGFDINKIFGMVPQPDDNGNYVFGNDHGDKWIESPAANLAFWHAADGYLYVAPNITAIAAAADSDEELQSRADMGAGDLASIVEILQSLKEYGVDVTALTKELTTILEKGFAVKYSIDGDNLLIYVDKATCDPIVKPLLPALNALDEKYEALLKSEDPDDQQTAQMIAMVFGMCGMSKPSDLIEVWNSTEEFQITLRLERAST